MGIDRPRIDTVARLAERAAHLELVPAEAPVPAHDLAEALLDRASPEATERVALERKTWGPVIDPAAESVQEISVAAIGPVAELAREISVPAIALAVEPVRCR